MLLFFAYHNNLNVFLNYVVSLDFEEVMALLWAFLSVRLRGSAAAPKVHVYDNQNAGYVLWTKANADFPYYDLFARDPAEKRGLKVREFRDYLIISSS